MIFYLSVISILSSSIFQDKIWERMCLKIMILNLKKMTRIETSKKQIGPTLLSAGLEHFRKIIKYILTINSSYLWC